MTAHEPPVTRFDMHVDSALSAASARIAALETALAAERAARGFERDVLDAMDAHVAVLDFDGRILAVNEAWRRFADDNTPAERRSIVRAEIGDDYLAACRRAAVVAGCDEARSALAGIASVMRGERARFELEYPCDAPDRPRWFLLCVTPLPGGSGRVVVAHLDITARRQAEALAGDQSRILERIATGTPLSGLLGEIAGTVEHHLPGTLCSILLLDGETGCLRTGAKGSLPDAYAAAFDGLAIGPEAGFFGSVAWRRAPVLADDIATNPLWKEHRDLALRHGLRACCAFPVLSAPRSEEAEARDVLGVFAVHATRVGPPGERVELVASRAVHLASVAIEAHRTACALRASQRHFRELSEHVPQLTWTCTPAGACDYLGPQWVLYTGVSAAEQLGDGWLAQLHPDDREPTAASWAVAVAAGAAFQAEFRIRRADGVYRWFDTRAVPLHDADGRRVKWFGTNTDVDDRKRAEQAVRQSETRLRSLLDHLYAFVGLLEPDGRVVYVNRAPLERAGLLLEDVVGRKLWECVWWKDDADAAETVRTAVERAAAGWQTRGDVTVRLADGRAVMFDLQVAALRDEFGNLVHLVPSAVDVTDREAAIAELRLRDRAIQAVSQGILITDATQPDNPIVYASPAFERLTGYDASEVLGRSSRFLQGEDTDPAAVETVRQAVREGREVAVELLNHRKDGSRFRNALSIAPIRDGGRVTHYVGVQTDVTEQRLLEEQYRHSQKMDAFGQLAGGVAHDFNNILTIINGEVEILAEECSASDPRRESLAAIHDAGKRAASLTAQLLAFTRKTIVEPKRIDPNEAVQQIGRMLRRLLGEDVTLALDLAPGVHGLKVDPGQFEQAIMNLALNARDAMPTGGRLTIETRDVELQATDLGVGTHGRPGRYVRLAVSDTGSGMNEETKSRIFEPFFTTKEVGKGTGLGLATVYGIVRSYGGHLHVWSEPGHGTTMTLFLPAAEEAAVPREVADASPPPAHGTETVLLVEDEPAVRRIARIALEQQGYEVLEANGGREAIRVAEQSSRPIDLLLTDVVMPEMGGREVAKQVLKRHPAARVLYMSGYTDDAVVRHGVIEATDAFLQKPFSLAALTHKVRTLLDDLA